MKGRTTKHTKKLIRNLDLDIETEKKADEAILNELLEAQEKSNKPLFDGDRPNVLKILLWSKAGYLAASFLVIVSFVISFVLYGKVVDLRNELNLARQDSVTTPIDIATPASPNRLNANFVDTAEIAMLTKLFPTSIVDISLCGLSLSFATISAFFFFFARMLWSFSCVNATYAVSIPEKNAEKKISIIRIISSLYMLLLLPFSYF